MATSTLSLEPALTALQTPGFCYEANSGIGERASQPFEDIDTEAGLNFYEENFIKNEVSVVLEPFQTFAKDA
jgi:hypothetical protein